MPVPHARDRVTIRPAALLCSVAGLMLPAAALAQQATTDVPADIRVIGHRERIGQHHGAWRNTVQLERRSPTVGSA